MILYAHFLAFITIFIWGITFVSTKVLLNDFQPVEILFIRFLIGYFALCMVCRENVQFKTIKQELYFIFAGLTGICLYYLFENIALVYTFATNVGVIICSAPFFTKIFTYILNKKENPLNLNFFIGFILAIIGIYLISFKGAKIEINPLGDFLALLAAVVWAVYSIFVKKIAAYGYKTIPITKKLFFYGIIFMIPVIFFSDFHLNIKLIMQPVNLFNLMFLSLGASALCFVTWNKTVKILGAVKTSVYIYLTPVITLISSYFVLNEKITLLSLLGILFTLTGLLISQFQTVKET